MSWKALGKNLQELRVHLCQKGHGSKGTRDFVMSMYANIKKENPRFPLLIREAEGTPATLIARYDFGVEESVSVDGHDKAGVEAALQGLISKGNSMPRAPTA